MCGIAGFFGRNTNYDGEMLQAMLRSQAHRGPDAEKYIFESLDNYQIGLGHRRLSIIDTSELGVQPMTFDNLIITYNGEVYNFAEIKDELIRNGYTFTSSTDTEVILKAFHRWGIESVNKFRGMFSFCILDRIKLKAYLIRDRVGVKPLYYSHHADDFIFASEIKSLRAHVKFKNTICKKGVNLFLQYGYISAPWSIFEGTKKVRPGCYIEYDLVSNTLVEKQYWDMSAHYLKPKSGIDKQDAIAELETILTESFKLRMIADVPVGVLLSGGIDSSLVAAILQSNSSIPIETFTMGFENQFYDESSHAKKIADHLGTNHHEQKCTWKDAESIISVLPKMYDEPFADSSSIPTALISKFAKQSVSVVLSGDGGDEMFCGYSAYSLSAKRFDAMDKLPFRKFVGKMLGAIPDPIMKMYGMNFDLYNRYLKIKSVFQHDSVEDKYKSVTKTFSSYDINKLMLSNEPFAMPANVQDELGAHERMMLIDFHHYLPDDIMVKVDRATMYYSLEGREPLLDHKILEYAAQLPINFKMNKSILKTILAKYIPQSYFERTKHGFGVPVNDWLRKELRYLVDKYLDVEKIKKQAIFNHRYVKNLTQSFLKSTTNDNRVWTLLTFQIWYEEYFAESF